MAASVRQTVRPPARPPAYGPFLITEGREDVVEEGLLHMEGGREEGRVGGPFG